MSGPKRFGGQPGPNVEHDTKGVGKPSIYMMLDDFFRILLYMIWYCLIWCFVSDYFDFGEYSIFVIWFVEVADATFFCPCFGPQSLPTQTSPFLGIQVLILYEI